MSADRGAREWVDLSLKAMGRWTGCVRDGEIGKGKRAPSGANHSSVLQEHQGVSDDEGAACERQPVCVHVKLL